MRFESAPDVSDDSPGCHQPEEMTREGLTATAADSGRRARRIGKVFRILVAGGQQQVKETGDAAQLSSMML